MKRIDCDFRIEINCSITLPSFNTATYVIWKIRRGSQIDFHADGEVVKKDSAMG